MPSTLNDWPVLSCTVRTPRTGAWSVEGEARGDDPETGPGTLDFEGQAMTDGLLNAVFLLRPYRWSQAAETAATPELRRIADAVDELLKAVDSV